MERSALSRVRRHLIRAAASGIVFVGGIVVAQIGQLLDERSRVAGQLDIDPASASERILAAVGALLIVLGGVAAVRSLASAARVAMQARGGDARGAPVGVVVKSVGYLLVGITTLYALGIPLEGLLLGGALTGVVIGIAAQQTLGNFFAGIVLLAVRPFTVGQEVVLRSGPLGGEYEGRVTNMSLFYVDLATSNGTVALPNAGVLAAAVGPGARSATPVAEEEAGPQDGGPGRGPL